MYYYGIHVMCSTSVSDVTIINQVRPSVTVLEFGEMVHMCTCIMYSVV